jgi:hypothetical protein
MGDKLATSAPRAESRPSSWVGKIASFEVDVHVVIVHGRRAVGTRILLEGAIVDAEKPIGTASDRREWNLSGDFIQLDERAGSPIVDVTEDGEEDGEEMGEGFCRRQSRKYTSKVLALLVSS